ASDELRAALLVNPHDIDGLKDTILRAIDMPRHERRKRMHSLRKKVAENDVSHWSDSFLATLRRARRTRAAWGGSGLPGEAEWTVERPPQS
ncbi:hypothetical protein FJ656_18330, partial [Schumannella luteola]